MSAVLKPLDGFRAMCVQDLESVLRIERSAYEFPWAEAVMRDSLQAGYECAVYEQSGELTAYGVMSTGAQEAHILNLCVDPCYQRRGIGRLLLDYLIKRAGRLQVSSVFLEVRPSNHIARTLYDSYGFNEIGMRREYYPAHQGRENALVMGLELLKN